MKGKEKLLALGTYPLLSLADARAARDEAKRKLANNSAPGVAKAQCKRLSTINQHHMFEVLARKWWEVNKDRWTARHAKDVMHSLEKRIFPVIGQYSIKDIDTPLFTRGIIKY